MTPRSFLFLSKPRPFTPPPDARALGSIPVSTRVAYTPSASGVNKGILPS